MKTIFTSKTTNFAVKLASASFVLLIAVVLYPPSAHAYIDPGSGSIIVTTVLGFIAAIGYTFRKFFYKLKRRIAGSNSQDD